MSGEISNTSMFLSRLANLKQGQNTNASASAAKTTGDKTSVSAQTASKNSTPTSEPVTIVVTSLNQKVQDLQKLLDGLDKNITALSTSKTFVDQALATLEEAGGIAVRARDTLKSSSDISPDRIKDLETRFAAVITKLDDIVDKAVTGNANLLKGEELVTNFDSEGKNKLATTGLDISSKALEIRAPDFSSVESIQDTRIDIMNSIDIATSLRHILSSDMMLIQTRQEFSQETISTLSAGAEQVPGNSIGDEAANLLALQIRQQLSETDTALASESQQFLLKQF